MLFIDVSTVTLTLTEKLVKKVENLLKTLVVLQVLLPGLFSCWYGGCCIMQTSDGKINKTLGIYI